MYFSAQWTSTSIKLISLCITITHSPLAQWTTLWTPWQCTWEAAFGDSYPWHSSRTVASSSEATPWSWRGTWSGRWPSSAGRAGSASSCSGSWGCRACFGFLLSSKCRVSLCGSEDKAGAEICMLIKGCLAWISLKFNVCYFICNSSLLRN